MDAKIYSTKEAFVPASNKLGLVKNQSKIIIKCWDDETKVYLQIESLPINILNNLQHYYLCLEVKETTNKHKLAKINGKIRQHKKANYRFAAIYWFGLNSSNKYNVFSLTKSRNWVPSKLRNLLSKWDYPANSFLTVRGSLRYTNEATLNYHTRVKEGFSNSVTYII